MSLPVYLDSCKLSAMPNGSDNQWAPFFAYKRLSLEANAFLPVYWLLLFSEEHLKQALFIDDFDANDPNSTTERQEALQQYGERTYPYFIAKKDEALQNLKRRKDGFLAIFGETYRSSYTQFQIMISEEYRDPYILLRTSGLGDIDENTTPIFSQYLASNEKLQNKTAEQDVEYWDSVKKTMQVYKNNVSYYLMGSDSLAKKKLEVSEIVPPHIPEKPKQKELSDRAIWLVAIISGVATAIVYYQTRAVWYSVVTFAALAFLLTYGITKLTGKR